MKKKNVMISIGCLLVTIIYIVLIKVVDVAPIGPNDSSVGFSTINSFVKESLPYNETIYKITEYLGYAAILVAGIYALVGFLQLVKRKSLKKVDKEIYLLAVLYVVVVILYALFEVVIINYRPILMEGELEASFPSSHTMLALTICGSGILFNNFKRLKCRKLVNTLLGLIMCAIIIGRFISGVHWATDIIGGILISTTLLVIFETGLNKLKAN